LRFGKPFIHFQPIFKRDLERDNMVEGIRIIIKRVRHIERDPFMELCNLSGVYSTTDKNRVAMRILLLLHKYGELNSTDISKELGISRGSVLNHIENLMESGFVFKYGKSYHLRESTFSEIVEQMEKDIKKTLERMRQYAKELDSQLSD